jgi:hypothetical protein
VLLALAIVGLFVLPDPWGVIAVFAAAVIEFGEVLFWIGSCAATRSGPVPRGWSASGGR